MANPQPDRYVKISTEVLEALAKIRIAGEARQMLDVIIRKTYGFNKKEDMIATSQFSQSTGLTDHAVHKARKKLVQMNLITITQKGQGITQKGYREILTYSFQKDYNKWLPLPKKVTVPQKGQRVYPKKVKGCTPKRSLTIDNITIDNNTINNKAFAFLQNPDFNKTWQDYLGMRKAIKRPATSHAQVLTLKKLHTYTIGTAIKMMEQSIEHSWQAVYPLRKEQEHGKYQRHDREDRAKELDAIGTEV
jgi:phage replication O-like protein O